MTEITSKIESIRNMKEDLDSIKMISQKNTEKMLQDLADFRNRICHEMSEIENSGRIYKQDEKSKSNQNHLRSISDCNDFHDSKQMDFILKEIKNVQKKSKEMIVELANYSELVTGVSSSLSNMYIGSQIKENWISSTDTLASTSTPDGVNILFSKQLPSSTSDSQETSHMFENPSSASNRVDNQLNNGKNIVNGNDSFTKEKIDKLTKKLKDIQTQNNELRNVNENIQNLLLKLSDLKYADAETVEKLETIKKDSQTSSVTYLPQIDSEAVLKAEKCQNFIRSIQITNQNRGNILTKIKGAKLIIKRLRSSGNVADQEHKYKVRVRQAEQNITFKAHHNKPQTFRLSNLK